MTEYGEKGHVEPDGPAIERRDGHLLVRKFSVEEMDNNVYVLACTRTDEALVVDAAARPERIRQELAGFSPVAVVQTHGHWDHVRAWDDLKEDPGLQIWGHPGDAGLFPGPLDLELTDGDVIEVGDLRIEVIHTPGHTDGSLHFLVEGDERPHLVTGDSLFPDGHGRTTTPEAHHLLMDGLESKLFGRLPDETWVYPGHGDDTTLGAERPKLGDWRERGW